MSFENKKNVTKIHHISNYYGTLFVRKYRNKFYMVLTCPVARRQWQQISEELYNELISLDRKPFVTLKEEIDL